MAAALRRDILDRAEELRDLLRRGEEREAALRVRSLQERCGAEAGRLPGCEDAAAARESFFRRFTGGRRLNDTEG